MAGEPRRLRRVGAGGDGVPVGVGVYLVPTPDDVATRRIGIMEPSHCPDCNVGVGEPHLRLCDWATCMSTGERRLGHVVNGKAEEHDCGANLWAGQPDGEAECIEWGWYACLTPLGWVPCSPDAPGAIPDRNRLHTDAIWDPQNGRWQRIVRRPALAGDAQRIAERALGSPSIASPSSAEAALPCTAGPTRPAQHRQPPMRGC